MIHQQALSPALAKQGGAQTPQRHQHPFGEIALDAHGQSTAGFGAALQLAAYAKRMIAKRLQRPAPAPQRNREIAQPACNL